MKKFLSIGFILSCSVMADNRELKTVSLQESTDFVSHQCRANADDGAYGFAIHMNIYSAQETAIQKCQAASRRPETCVPAGCFQIYL